MPDDRSEPQTNRRWPLIRANPSRTPQRLSARQIREAVNRGASLDLNLLRAFVRVVDVASLHAAAVDLGYAAPKLSQRLRVLERKMGYRLIAEESPRIRLTAYGSELLPYVRVMLGTVDALRQQTPQEEPPIYHPQPTPQTAADDPS